MSYKAEILSDTPLAYWKLDESTGASQFADSSGNNRPATIVGNPTYDTVSCVDTSSIKLDGSSYGSVDASSWFSSMSSFSAEGWFKVPSMVGDGVIVGRDNAGNSPGAADRIFRLYLLSSGYVYLFISNSLGVYVEVGSSLTYLDDAWHHAAATYDGTAANLYVDGELVGSKPLSGVTATGGTAPLLIGTGQNWSPGNYTQFRGSLDEVAIYGTALSPSRIKAHYDVGITFSPAMLTGKLLWLRAKDLGADSSSIDVWPDQSGLSHSAIRGLNAPTVVDASTPLGGKSARFAGSSFLHFTNYRGIPIAAATASSYYTGSPGFPPGNAIDGLPEQSGYKSVWASTTLPAWLQLQPTAPTVVTSYGTTVRIGPSVNQAPKDWTLEGSNDGTNWTVLDTRTGETPVAGESRVYSFTNTVTYAYYRINITAANGSTLTSLADFSLNPVAGYGTTNNPLAASTTAAEVWAVIKADSTSPLGLWSWGQESGAGDETFYPYTDGKIYESFGVSTGKRPSFTPTAVLSAWQIYRVRNDGTSWEAWLSGQTQATATGLPFGYADYQTIGVGRRSGANDYFFRGNIAEIIVRDQISSAQESADIYSYLVSEHLNTSPTTRYMYETSIDVMTVPIAAPRILNETYAEAITVPLATPRMINEIYVDVLTPAILKERFVGWGNPI